MNWQDERWIKLYTRDGGDWLFLSFDAQALFLMLLRKVDRAGYLALGRKGVDAVPVLLGHAGAADRIGAALKALLDDGCVRLCGEALFVPNFEEAQEAATSAEERKRRFKELDVARNGLERDGTRRNGLELTEQSRETRQEEKKQVASKLAPGSAFQAFLQEEWPDIKKPAEYERRAKEAYPALNLLAEAQKAKGWETANPRKAKSNHGNYFWRWLGRAQQFVAENAPDAEGKRRADASAEKSREETKQRNAALAAIKPTPPPKELQAMMAKIGNGK